MISTVKDFIPLTDDRLFKEVLANEKTRKFLIYFLEIFTELPKEIITDNLRVSYEKPLPKSKYHEKSLSGDIIIYFANYAVNVEMYSLFTKDSIIKSGVYSMRIFSTQLKPGQDYKEVKNLLQLNFVYNVGTSFNKNVKSGYALTDIYNEYESMLADKFFIKYYRIDKAKEDEYNESEENKLLRYIGADNEKERKMIAKGNEVLMETEKVIDDYIKIDREFAFEFQLSKREDEINYYKEQAKKEGMEEGHKEGLEKGIQKGMQKGMQEGIEKGLLKGTKEKSFEIAKNMKLKNYSVREIQELTNLSIEEIEKL